MGIVWLVQVMGTNKSGRGQVMLRGSGERGGIRLVGLGTRVHGALGISVCTQKVAEGDQAVIVKRNNY